MSTSARRFSGWLCVAAFALAFSGVEPASAQVTQTDAAKTPLPQPVGMAEESLVDNSWAWNANTLVNRDPMGVNLNPAVKYGDYYSPANGYPQFVTGDAINLSGLFKWRKEMLDPVKSAKTGPGYFSAKCGFDGELLLMGGNCQVKFGWYNVTDPKSTTPPAATEIYDFIPAPAEALNCVEGDGKSRKMDGFCPLAWDNRHPYDLSILRWTPKVFNSGDISKDPRYKGGYVAFAVIGDPAKCPQNKYSMYEHNQRNMSNVPWVTTLIYQSTIDPSAFYMAFEDLPMPQNDWKAQGSDGDFNDFVFYVSGLTCDGGNKPCNTGQMGACSVGRTDCASDGVDPVCRPVIQKGVEVCDNVDNDCDGVIDNGMGLCTDPDKPICFQGTCVGTCTGGEFPCPVGLTCDDSGHCSDPVCASVSCAPGTACRQGKCVDPCTDVVCPYGKQCELGQCVDPCAGVTCPGDRVCEKGLCVSNCTCRGCDTGLACGADGKCVDTACATKSCPNGTLCKLGDCIDPCLGVKCPNNGTCSMGTCSVGMPGTGATGTGGGGSSVDFGGVTTNPGGAGDPGRITPPGAASKGCGCRFSDLGSAGPRAPLALLGSALGLGLLLRRRKRSARSAAEG